MTTPHWRVCLVVIAAAVMAAPASGQNRSEMATVDGHVLDFPAGARRVDVVPRATGESTGIDLTVVLRRSDPAGFAAYLDDVYDPRSPRFRRFLTAREVSDRFGPSAADYAVVRAWFERGGFTVTSDSANRMTFTVAGTRTAAAATLDVAIDDYALGERRFVANDRDPRLPRDVALRVQAVIGLSSLARPQPADEEIDAAWMFLRNAGKPGADALEWLYDAFFGLLQALGMWGTPTPTPTPGPGNAGALADRVEDDPAVEERLALHPRGTATPWKDVDGAGQTIGITAFDTFDHDDVRDFIALLRLPPAIFGHLSQVHVNGGAAPGPNQSEVLLDVDLSLLGAPGAQVVVYDSPFTGAGSFQALFSRMIDDGVTVISNSWAYCEDQTTQADVESIDSILATAAAAGISVFNAAGDDGGTCLDGSPDTAHVPASSTHATAVGGTSLIRGPGGTFVSETWWDGTDRHPAHRTGWLRHQRLLAAAGVPGRLPSLADALAARRRHQRGSGPGNHALPGRQGRMPGADPLGWNQRGRTAVGGGRRSPQPGARPEPRQPQPDDLPAGGERGLPHTGGDGQRLRACRAGVAQVQRSAPRDPRNGARTGQRRGFGGVCSLGTRLPADGDHRGDGRREPA